MKEFALYELVETSGRKTGHGTAETFQKCLRKRRLLQWFRIYYAWNPAKSCLHQFSQLPRIPGWSAHRLEEILNASKIIRPAYKYVGHHANFVPFEEREPEEGCEEVLRDLEKESPEQPEEQAETIEKEAPQDSTECPEEKK